VLLMSAHEQLPNIRTNFKRTITLYCAINPNQQMHIHQCMKVYYVHRISPSRFGELFGHLYEGALHRWPHEWSKPLGCMCCV
jgi:hypothetical protein